MHPVLEARTEVTVALKMHTVNVNRSGSTYWRNETRCCLQINLREMSRLLRQLNHRWRTLFCFFCPVVVFVII